MSDAAPVQTQVCDAPALIEDLAHVLATTDLEDLPGAAAQRRMAPSNRTLIPEPGVNPRQSAILMLLYPSGGEDEREIEMLFTVRAPTLGHHSGEISFPGGGAECVDDTLRETALREVEEELGIPPDSIHILGELTPLYIPPSRNLVHPFVGWMPSLPPLDPDPIEVAEVLRVSLAHLLDPQNIDSYVWRHNGRMFTAPSYQIDHRDPIWGATAMMLSELLTVIEKVRQGASRFA
jgi:8-oxo-dGTP pyrophosphatase MutT (NUDIX family)